MVRPETFQLVHVCIHHALSLSLSILYKCRALLRNVNKKKNTNSYVGKGLDSGRSETSPMLSGQRRIHSSSENSAIGFVGAMKIPGVIEYSLSLFFAKLVSYTFLYWLPLYIATSSWYICKIK